MTTTNKQLKYLFKFYKKLNKRTGFIMKIDDYIKSYSQIRINKKTWKPYIIYPDKWILQKDTHEINTELIKRIKQNPTKEILKTIKELSYNIKPNDSYFIHKTNKKQITHDISIYHDENLEKHEFGAIEEENINNEYYYTIADFNSEIWGHKYWSIIRKLRINNIDKICEGLEEINLLELSECDFEPYLSKIEKYYQGQYKQSRPYTNNKHIILSKYYTQSIDKRKQLIIPSFLKRTFIIKQMEPKILKLVNTWQLITKKYETAVENDFWNWEEINIKEIFKQIPTKPTIKQLMTCQKIIFNQIRPWLSDKLQNNKIDRINTLQKNIINPLHNTTNIFGATELNYENTSSCMELIEIMDWTINEYMQEYIPMIKTTKHISDSLKLNPIPPKFLTEFRQLEIAKHIYIYR